MSNPLASAARAKDNHHRSQTINVVSAYEHLNDGLLIAPRKGELEFDDVTSDNAQYGSVQVSRQLIMFVISYNGSIIATDYN